MGNPKDARSIDLNKPTKVELELFFDNSLDIMVLMGFDNRIKIVNPSFERILGWKKEEVISKYFQDFLLPDDLERSVAEAKAHKFGSDAIRFENRYRCKDGSYKWISWNSHPLIERQIIVGIGRDITERKQAEANLEEYTKNLEKLVEERTKQLQDKERLATIGATAGMVGHDIRNPLQAITGDIYLTKTELDSLPDSEAKSFIKENLQAIDESIFYINKIVADLQDFARPLKPDFRRVELEPLIRAAFQDKVVPGNIKTSYHIDVDIGTICTDIDLLKRILNNLGMNAIQAMPNGGKITVTVSREQNNVVLSVQDTGEGIPEEVKPRLFTPMMTTKPKGQGFGLAVVKRLTEVLGGTISFESEKGKGTTFIIRLPPPRV